MMNTSTQRPRNILSFGDKVRVIKAYRKDPCLKDLADEFKCSRRQIKSIVDDKKTILAQHAAIQSRLGPSKKVISKLECMKFELIPKVMFEWYQRARVYPASGTITYKTIREKVQEAKKVLQIENFIPTNEWLVKFRTDCEKIQSYKNPKEATLKSLNMNVIAKSVLRQEENYGHESGDVIVSTGSPEPMTGATSSREDYLCDDMEIPNAGTLDIIDDREISEDIKFIYNGVDSLHKDKGQDIRVIKNCQEAVEYLKPLEDFVLLKENFRAIGLLSQIEAILLKTTTKCAEVEENIGYPDNSGIHHVAPHPIFGEFTLKIKIDITKLLNRTCSRDLINRELCTSSSLLEGPNVVLMAQRLLRQTVECRILCTTQHDVWEKLEACAFSLATE